MDPITGFNISRAFTFIGGLITLSGIVGLWYFGNINSKNTAIEITNSKEKAAEANAEAAKANNETSKLNTKSKELELQIAKANEETQRAKNKTRELELEIEKTNLEAEKSKLERDKLLNQQKFIKSVAITLKIYVPTIKKNEFNNSTFMNESPQGLLKTPLSIVSADKRASVFLLSSWTHQQASKDELILTLIYKDPERKDLLYGKQLDYLKDKVYFDCISQGIIKKYEKEIDKTKRLRANIQISINGINCINTNTLEVIPNKYLNERIIVNMRNEFKKIPDIVLGNDELSITDSPSF